MGDTITSSLGPSRVNSPGCAQRAATAFLTPSSVRIISPNSRARFRTAAVAMKSRALTNTSCLGRRPSTAAGATPARRKRLAQKNWSPANGVTMDGTPARATECEVPEPP